MEDMPAENQSNGLEDALDDAALAQLLDLLVCLARIEYERPGKPCSLAKLSKQSARPMSILRRQLTLLADAAWVVVALDEQGGGTVALAPAGIELSAHLAPEK